MGSTFSASKDNDELINLLLYHNHISSKRVERAFRAVDRGDYISPSHRESAYHDISCKVGNIHLSAPCVYGSVIERLSLKPGLSFLNIGSGTGYLSTIAGLILGDDGTNHGIEMHEDCLIYAQEHLEEFKRNSLDVDVFEFCEPVFCLGNFLNVIPNRQYDRVYCGAACPKVHEKFVKQFVKIGGILVMPYEDQLLRSKKTGEETWRNNAMLPVSFATLMSPKDGTDRCLLQLPQCTPRSLQELCRSSIRRHLRSLVWAESKDLEEKETVTLASKTDQALSGWQSELVIPIAHDHLPLQTEGIPASVQIAINSSMHSILAECLRPFISLETGDDSDDSESEADGLFAPRCAMDPYPMREQSNSETRESDNNTWERNHYGFDEEEEEEEDEEEKEEDENTMDYEVGNYVKAKETQDVTMEEETERGDDKGENPEDEKAVEKQEDNGEQSGSNCGQSSSCKKKRSASEKSNNSSEDVDSAHKVMSNDVFKTSLYKRAMLRMKTADHNISNSDSSASLSDDDNEDERARRISQSFMTNSKGVGKDEELNDESISSENDGENSESSLLPHLTVFPVLKYCDDQSTKIRNLTGRRCNGDNNGRRINETGKIEDKNNRIINVDSSDTSSSEDEYDSANKANNRRDYRIGLKRRSERKTLSPGSDGSSSFGKKFNLSEFNNSNEKSPSTVNSATSSSAKKSSTSGYSFSTSANSSNDDTRSDSDNDTYFSVRESNDVLRYSHAIRKDLFASHMKKKVLQLPIPPPLRLYVNYNRPLV